MKFVNIIFIILFVFSAAVQYNDPDPYVWIPIYLFGAIICFLAIIGRFNIYKYLFGFAVYIGYAVILLLTGVQSWWREHHAESIVQTMKAEKPWIEETREFFGLLILIFALALNWWWFRKKGHLGTKGKDFEQT